MKDDKSESARGSSRTYVIGFGLSLLFTLSAYALVAHHAQSRNILLFAIFSLAIIQLIAQLIFFLHLGADPKRRWNLTVLAFAAIVLVILVFGSLWIMYNLNYHMAPADHQTDRYILKDEGFRQ